MAKEKFSDQQAAIIAPVIEKLLTMMGAARDAFNRHSRDRLQELRSLQGAVSQEVTAASRQAKSLATQKTEAEKPILLRLETVLQLLDAIGGNLAGLANPIEQKVKGAVLFSDKAVAQANYLFDQHAGMIRSVLDIIKTDNDFLKKYLRDEGRNLVRACDDYATEHRDRLIEGVCTPQAAPIFLAILDAMRAVGQGEVEIARLLEKA